MKKSWWLLIPIFAGVFLGQLVFSAKDFPEGILSPEVEVPSGRKEKMLASTVLSNSQVVSDHLLSSQTLFSKAIELSSQNTDSSYNERIVQLINEAVTEATEAIVVNPQDPRGYVQRGKIYKTIEKYLAEATTAALADYQQAIRLDPRQVSYYEETVLLLNKMGRKFEALNALKNCVYINPAEPQGWYELAKLQAQLGLLSEAKESYQRILALLVDEGQKETVRREVETIDKLLVQTQNLSREAGPSPTTEAEREIVFPDEPPKIEAKIASKVIIAAPEAQRVEKEGGEVSSNAFSEVAVLPAGEKRLKIESQNLAVNSQVYLAAEDDLSNEVLRVESKDEGWFTVVISHPLEREVNFRWWIIN